MKRALIALIIPLLFIAGCGADNRKFNGDFVNPLPPAGAFDIDAGNALGVTAVTYDALLQSGELAGLAGSIDDSLGGGLTKGSFNRQVGGVLNAVVQAADPLEPIVGECFNEGGTVTFTFDIIDPLILLGGMFSVGDTVLIEYLNCDEGFGEIVDGTIDGTIDAFAGDIFSGNGYAMTMAMNLTDFQVDIGSDVFTSNGDATAALDTRVSLYVSASVGGSLMTTDRNNSSEVLTDYSSAQTLDLNLDPTEYTATALGTLDSTQIDGLVDYSTPVGFLAFDLNNPHLGQLLVTAETGSARLIAQENAIDVVIEVYSTSDGTGEPVETINTTWAELAAM